MSEALARVGAALDRWGTEQRLRKWAKDLADGEVSTPSDRVTYPLIGRSAENP